jgi:hypothetical protein
MINFQFNAPDLDALVRTTIQQHIASAVTNLICPVHGTRLEAVHIAGDSLDHLDLRMEGCCDELLSLANAALGADENSGDDEASETRETPTGDKMGSSATLTRPLRAFICHASEDKEIARRLARDLHAAGIDTFFDEWEINAGNSLRGKIDEGIASCTHFVVLLTPTSLTKPWVNAELDAGYVQKIKGQSLLIPLRYQLGVDRLPPLLAALHCPEIRDYDRDVPRLIDEIRGLTRKPPVASTGKVGPSWGPNLALSPLGATVAELLATRSEDGRSGDPQLPVSEMRQATNAVDQDLIDAISELEDLGWAEPQRAMGAAPFGYQFITPTAALFEHVDLNVMGWDPAQDAGRIAAELVNADERGLQAHDLVDRLAWTPRRLNPALSYLISRDLVLFSTVNDPVFVTHYIGETPKTRRFVRSAS